MSFSSFRKLLAVAAVLVLIGLSIVSRTKIHSQTLKTWKPEKIGKDAISLWDHRFEEMQAYLPQHGVIGYINDKSVPGRKLNSLDASGEYNLTRYSLTPLILADDPNEELVVGNFSFNDTPPPFKSMGFTVVKQFDAEIYLLKRQPK
jgi:hypothetical protein